MRVAVVGAGVFGATAALELRRRGREVVLVDPGPLPHPHASSTDITKMVRMDYGADELYTEMMEEALPRWRAWNEQWGAKLYHQDGYLVISSTGFEPGTYEAESLETVRRRGHQVEVFDRARLAEVLPQWRLPDAAAAYLNPEGGWAESGKVVGRLLDDARHERVELLAASVAGLSEHGGRVAGIRTAEGEEVPADVVVLAAGPWAPKHVPELATAMWPVGQPVYHFHVDEPDRWRPPQFYPWAADIGRTGWYGFVSFDDGTFKFANHGPGWRVDPDGPRALPEETEAMFRTFLAERLPELANAPVLKTRMCFYCDTWDGNFWIDHHPDRPGLVLATGGAGHGFKFAPVLGPLIADVVEGNDNPWAHRFAWRPVGALDHEAARYIGE